MIIERYHTNGGVERRTSELVRGLVAAGHRVSIYTNHWSPEMEDDRIRFHRLPVLKLDRRLRPLSFSWACRMYVRAASHDIVHTQARVSRYDVATLGVGCHRAYLDAMKSGPNNGCDKAPHRVILGIERRMFSACGLSPGRMLITNSHRCKAEFAQYYGVPEERMHVVHNGVDQELFSPSVREGWGADIRERLGISPDDLLVLFVGSGFERKGVDTLIEALGILKLRGLRAPAVKALVIGRGHQEAFERMSAEHGVYDDMIWSSKADPRQIARIYAAADVFALPTRYDPFANSTMEALATGIPVVTTTTNGVSEILRDGESALLTGPNDPEALADRLAALAQDAGLRARMGSAGRKAVEPYTWQAATEKTMAVYEAIMNQRKH